LNLQIHKKNSSKAENTKKWNSDYGKDNLTTAPILYIVAQ